LNCLVCKEGKCAFYLVIDNHAILRCKSCGSTRREHQPDDSELAEFYNEYLSYKTQFGDGYLLENNAQSQISKEISLNDVGMTGEIFTGKRVLDVGCGTGQLMEWIAHFEPAVLHGLDMSFENVKLGLIRSINISTENFLAVDEKYHVIIMSHLIEHLPDPLLYMEHSFKLLIEGGLLIVETPCVGAVQEAFGENWRYWLPNEHLVIFSETGLFEMFKRTGFTRILKTRFGSGVNDSDVTSTVVKRSIDRVIKSAGFGDTIFMVGSKV
jgi:2-polyprenyl-3-methyl-5-hydroxy-6-metoxy-1,4-benzoquinol methylase